MPTLIEIVKFRENSLKFNETIQKTKEKRFVISIVKRLYKKKERIAILVFDKLNFRYTEAIHTNNENRALSRYESTLNHYRKSNCIVIDKIELIKKDIKLIKQDEENGNNGE